METEIDGERTHSIKLPSAVEVFANLKNAQKFAIDIGMFFFLYFIIFLWKFLFMHKFNLSQKYILNIF